MMILTSSNLGDITTMISTVGFPIVCCAAMFWNNIQMNQAHQKEMDKMSEALNNNTLALQKLSTLMEMKGDM